MRKENETSKERKKGERNREDNIKQGKFEKVIILISAAG